VEEEAGVRSCWLWRRGSRGEGERGSELIVRLNLMTSSDNPDIFSEIQAYSVSGVVRDPQSSLSPPWEHLASREVM